MTEKTIRKKFKKTTNPFTVSHRKHIKKLKLLYQKLFALEEKHLKRLKARDENT